MEQSAADMIWDDPFDSIDDLLDFPNDDDVIAVVGACGGGGGGGGGGGALLPPPQAAPAMSSAGEIHDRPGANSGEFKEESDALGLCSDIDITNLEWLSNFFEDTEFNFDFPATAGDGATINIPNNKDDSLFRSSSPISVLELNSLCGGTATMGGGSGAYSSSTASSCSSSNSIGDRSITARPPPPPAPIPARARTKRPRPPCFSARSFVPPPSSDYPSAISYPARPAEPAEPESVGESYPVAMKKKRKKNVFYVPERGHEEKWAEGAVGLAVRKCMHCEIQKTPQWRAGPMGPKTLCNACGVRYKSGRLFPEYRPAASPTYVPSIHSNSHKKVVEMRLMSNETAAGNVGMRPQEGTVAAKNCDLLKYIRRQD